MKLTRLERFILSSLSLFVGLGLAYLVKGLVWRAPGGPTWLKAVLIGGAAIVGYFIFDYHLFRSAERELEKKASNKR